MTKEQKLMIARVETTISDEVEAGRKLLEKVRQIADSEVFDPALIEMLDDQMYEYTLSLLLDAVSDWKGEE